MRGRRWLGLRALGIAAILLAGCASKVRVAPAVDLRSYGIIGLIELAGDVDRNRAALVTGRFLESLHGAQPGVRVLELGDEERVLRAVERGEWDSEAIRAIGKKFEVDAVLAGRLALSDLKPGGSISRSLTSVSVHADVEGSLRMRLYETKRGATVWTASAHHEEPVAHARVTSNGPLDVDASSPEEAYEKLTHALVRTVTRDFRPRYVRR
jgi:hypothetical protein